MKREITGIIFLEYQDFLLKSAISPSIYAATSERISRLECFKVCVFRLGGALYKCLMGYTLDEARSKKYQKIHLLSLSGVCREHERKIVNHD